jgi:esterase/lipase superfamily enzyme
MFTKCMLRALSLLVVLLVATACTSRDDLMTPVGLGSPGARAVDMLVVTTRKPSEDKAQLFSSERGEMVSLANVVISVPPARMRKPGSIQWPTAKDPDPLRSFTTVKAEPIVEQQVGGWFARIAGQKKRVVVFVHGFNSTFSEATYRYAQFSTDLGVEMAPVLFTWPSRGNAVDYAYDWESTVYSRFGLTKVLDEAVRSPEVEEVFVVAHSMGGWLAMESLRQIGIRDKTISPKIKTVILASPDIDVDVFKRQVLEMGRTRPGFVLVASRNDFALSLSRWISGGVDRLGGADLRSHAALLASHGITVIDATTESSHDALQHNAFAESDVTIKLIAGFVDSGRQRPSARKSAIRLVGTERTR